MAIAFLRFLAAPSSLSERNFSILIAADHPRFTQVGDLRVGHARAVSPLTDGGHGSAIVVTSESVEIGDRV